MQDKPTWPPPVVENPPPLRFSLPLDIRVYTTNCPFCRQPHLTKAQFMVCRAGHKGY